MVGHDDRGDLLLLVETDLLDPRRAQRLGDERLGLLPPLDDVDLLATQFLHHLAYARPAGSHAGTDGVDIHVVGEDRDLGPVTGLAGDGADLDDAVDQLGHLELEERPDELGVAAAHDDLGTLALAAHLEDVGLDPVAALEALVGDALRGRHDRLGIAEIEHRIAMIAALHDAGDEVALPAFVQVVDLLALGIAQTLHDDLLGGRRGDATEVVRGVLPLVDDVAVLVELLAVHDDLAGVRVDGDPGLLGGARGALVGRDERVGEGIENGVRGDALVSCHRFECFEHFVDVHAVPFRLSRRRPGVPPDSQRKTVLALAMSPSAMTLAVPSTSTVISPSPTAVSIPVWFLAPSIGA